MNAAQFAWLYLVENGLAGLESNYYGGYKGASPAIIKRLEKMAYNDKYNNPFKEEFLREIKDVGVNWYQTEAPKSDIVFKFLGTFCDDDTVEEVKGTLVLNNGKEQKWSSEKLSVKNVFEMMAEAEDAKIRFAKIFGEV